MPFHDLPCPSVYSAKIHAKVDCSVKPPQPSTAFHAPPTDLPCAFHAPPTDLPRASHQVDGSDKPPEEQAALMTLDSWLKDTLAGLTASRQIPPPKEMLDMPEFKPPDDTRDSSGNDF